MNYFLFSSYIMVLFFVVGCSTNTSITGLTGNIATGSILEGTGSLHESSGAIAISPGNNISVSTDSSISTNTKNYSIDFSHEDKSIPLPLHSGDTISLRITQPSTKTFIRLSQIIFPDGSSDGPFSDIITYTTYQNGIHNFRIGTNLMASEEAYTGIVSVDINIKPYR